MGWVAAETYLVREIFEASGLSPLWDDGGVERTVRVSSVVQALEGTRDTPKDIEWVYTLTGTERSSDHGFMGRVGAYIFNVQAIVPDNPVMVRLADALEHVMENQGDEGRASITSGPAIVYDEELRVLSCDWTVRVTQ